MEKIIRIASVGEELFALTSDGKVYKRVKFEDSESCYHWKEIETEK